MGIVYRARDVKLNRDVALKVLPPELVENPDRKRRFIQEAQAAAALKHPNIAVVYEIDEDDGVTFIAMELVEGEKLSEVLDRGALPTDRAIEIATEVARGLACAHDHGVVHRDVKPANIVLTTDGHPKVIDFGLAKLTQDWGESGSEAPTSAQNETAPGQIMGTVSHMSPEQARAQKINHRTDVFSFGIVFHELLTGASPFQAPSAPEILTAIIKEPHARLPSERAKLQPIVDRCLAKPPEERYQAMREVVEALEADRPRSLSRLLVAIGLAAVVGLSGFWLMRNDRDEQSARDVGIAELQTLVDEDDYAAAFALAMRLDDILPEEPKLAELRAKVSQIVSVTTTPDDARIYFRSQSAPDAEWENLGASPLERRPVPYGAFWLRIEKEGFQSIETLVRGLGSYDDPDEPKSIHLQLDESGTIPADMVRIPAQSLAVNLTAIDAEPADASSYLIDKYEVTNREFKAFVDSGAYDNRDLWQHPFRDGERLLDWAKGMERFRDQTGRPGPSTWEVGTHAEGQREHPVSGVSWFEAAAYCESIGKHLPTVFHWTGATQTFAANAILPISNFGGQEPVPVGSHPPGVRGTYDMAGNVKEWCWNRAAERRYLLGGAWDEPTYMFYEPDAQSPFDRSSRNGFRCADFLDADDDELEPLLAPIDSPAPSVDIEPVSDEVFQAYAAVFEFDPIPLDARIEAEEELATWTREKISFRAGYADENVVAYLFLPKSHEPPYQTIVYFPGSSAVRQSSPDQLQMRMVDFLITSGRAVMYPVYKGTHERREDLPFDAKAFIESRAYVDYVTYWMSDLTRSVEYLTTRNDIRTDELGYYGFSWGAQLGPIALALDERLGAAVLLAGGIGPGQPRPEVRPYHYAPRVRTPVLMVNGAHDAFFPLESSQKTLFELLGTAPEHKEHVVYPGGHSVFTSHRNQAIGDILDWFDRYLGPTS